jgi:hypothetical protein
MNIVRLEGVAAGVEVKYFLQALKPEHEEWRRTGPRA